MNETKKSPAELMGRPFGLAVIFSAFFASALCLGGPKTADRLPAMVPYEMPAFKMSASKKFLSGALFDTSGQVICVLPDDPGAYVYTGVTPDRPVQAEQCEAFLSDIKEGRLSGIQKLDMSNSDLLRRVIWFSGEGGCNPVCEGSGCEHADEKPWASLQFAYVIKALRKRFKSDDHMLHGSCVDKTGNLYNEYFVDGARTGPMRAAAKDPAQWSTVPKLWSSQGGQCKSDALCWARQSIARCIQDVIGAELDSQDQYSPFADQFPALDQWSGLGTSRSCPNSWLGVAAQTYAGTRALHCFHR